MFSLGGGVGVSALYLRRPILYFGTFVSGVVFVIGALVGRSRRSFVRASVPLLAELGLVSQCR